jgi:hypothetical protein
MSNVTISVDIRSTSGNPLSVSITGPSTHITPLMQELLQAVNQVRANNNVMALTHVPPTP